MGMNKVWLPFLFIGIFACAASGEENALDQALLARLTGEGCEALRQLEEYFGGLHIQWYKKPDDGFTPRYGQYYPSRGGFKMQLTVDRDDVVPTLHFSLRNSDYFFEISKNPDDTVWKIDDCVPLEHFDPYDHELTDDYYTILPFFIDNQPLARMIKEGEITITSIRTSDDSPEEAVVFDFTHNREYPPNELVSGTLTLLPKKCWVISSADLLFNDGHPFRDVYSFEYDENEDYPFFDYKKMTVSLILGDDESTPPRVTWTYDIKQIDHQTVPSKELRLSFYGLPEPEFVRSVERSRFMLVAAGLLMIAAAGVMIMKKKSSAAAGSPARTSDDTNNHSDTHPDDHGDNPS